MRFSFRRNVSLGVAVALVVLVIYLPFAASVSSAQDATPPIPTTGVAAAATASLHNPTFDNGDWYEFNRRYQAAYPVGSWLPDDDNNTANNIPESVRQDWRLWFHDRTAIVQTWAEQNNQHAGNAAVRINPYPGSLDYCLAGLYQVVYNTTPGRVYEFQMYVQSRPVDSGDTLVASQVGIDKAGWHPNSTTDPAVHYPPDPGAFPATTVWGPSMNAYSGYYGPVAVMAEALANQITVFTYAEAHGGSTHQILWDTGSFQEMQLPLVATPDNPPAATISSVTVVAGSTSATLVWSTPEAAMVQVSYRLLSSPTTIVTSTASYSYTVYLPMVNRSTPWLTTSLDKAITKDHTVSISGLQPNSLYEYIVAGRGISNGQFVTWVSQKRTFTTAP